MEVFGVTDTGKVRKENQDTFVIERFEDKGAYLCAVLDGMGGARGGKVASSLGADTFVSHMRTILSGNSMSSSAAALREAADYANMKVVDRSLSDSNCRGMGTTLVAAWVLEDGATILNIGDSRAYLVSDGEIRQISRDHSYVEDMVRLGNLTAAEAKKHPRRNLITRALGVDQHANCDTFEIQANSGDILILCSDGLSNELTDNEIYQTAISGNVQDICKTLLDTALNRGASDNVTVLAVKY